MSNAFHFRARIRFIDTDASGRIHFTSLFRYFESAEIELFRAAGMAYIDDRPYAFPRVHVECDYKLALTHDDEIDIETSVARLGVSSVEFGFRVFKDGDLAACGRIVAACMDKATKRAVPIPDEYRAVLLPFMDTPPDALP